MLRRKPLVFVIAFVLASSIVPSRAWSQAEDPPADDAPSETSPRLEVVGTFHRFPSDLESMIGEAPEMNLNQNSGKFGGMPFFDVENRRIFQLYELKRSGSQARGIAITIRHMNSFRGAGVIKMPEYRSLSSPYFPSSFPDAAVEVDEQGRRLFLWVYDWNNPASEGQGKPGLIVVDWDREKPVYRFTPVPLPEGTSTTSGLQTNFSVPTMTGMTFHPTSRKLYLRIDSDPTSAGPNVASVVQVDATQDDPLAVKIEWSRVIRGCRWGGTLGTDGKADDFPVLRSAEDQSLYIPCNPGSATAVVRVPLSEAGLPVTEEVFNGIGFALHYTIDPEGGRIHIKTTSGPTGLAVLTFDIEKRAYVGLSALQDPRPDEVNGSTIASPIGVDPTSGRVYALSDAAKYGLTVFEGRLSPVPPGRQFPQVRHRHGRYPKPAIRFDPLTRRIFVPRWGSDTTPGDFLILRDETPAPSVEDVDVDTLTSDVKDDEGVSTQADYSGGASAYGLRLLLAGGARGVPQTSVVEGAPPDYTKSPCRATDRDLLFGRVERTFLSSAGRSASSIAGDADLTTRTDLSEPSRCRDEKPLRDLESNGLVGPTLQSENFNALMGILTNPVYDHLDVAGQTWAFRRTECPIPGEDGTTLDQDEASGQPPFAGSRSSVDCLPKKAQVVASSTARLPLPGAPVTFGDAASFTEVVRDPKRGLVSRAIAYVRDIDIGGVVQIDGVYAVAESFATGRPEKSNKIGAGTKYIRAVTGFTSPGFSCGHEGEDPCGDPSALVDGVNRAFVNLGVQLRFPPLDPKLAEGTPGGYQSGVQREFFNSLNAEFANGDILKEVPALEIVRTNDSKNFGRQRQTYQFAGVLVNSQYGIRELGAGFEGPSIDSGGSTDPVPAVEQVLGGAVDGLGPLGPAPAAGGALSTAPGLSDAPPLASGPADTGSLVPEIGRRITQGLGFLARNPKTAGLMVGAWILLLLPGALAYRRRLLLNAVMSTGGGRS